MRFSYRYYRGRVGLYWILKALGVGAGDEVAIPGFTCLAVPEAIFATGASPLYIDIGVNSVNVTAGDLQAKITPRTKVIVLQHTFGIPVDAAALLQVSRTAGLHVVEDCCHTLQSEVDGKRVGDIGLAAFYSFEWGKPVVAGVGGAVRVNDSDVERSIVESSIILEAPSWDRELKLAIQYLGYKLVYSPRRYWMLKDLFHKASGVGLAVGNFNGVVGNRGTAESRGEFGLKMSRVASWRLSRALSKLEDDKKRALALLDQYDSLLADLALNPVQRPVGSRTVPVRYPLFVDDKDGMLLRARELGVEVAEWYASPVHPLGPEALAKVGYLVGSCPQAERAAGRIVSFPIRGASEGYLEQLRQLLVGRA